MLLKRKVDRAMEWSRHRHLREQGRDPEQEELEAEIRRHGKGKGDEMPSMEELRAEALEELKNEPVDNKDVFSMITAAFLTIFPVCVGLILLICLLAYLFFNH